MLTLYNRQCRHHYLSNYVSLGTYTQYPTYQEGFRTIALKLDAASRNHDHNADQHTQKPYQHTFSK